MMMNHKNPSVCPNLVKKVVDCSLESINTYFIDILLKIGKGFLKFFMSYLKFSFSLSGNTATKLGITLDLVFLLFFLFHF